MNKSIKILLGLAALVLFMASCVKRDEDERLRYRRIAQDWQEIRRVKDGVPEKLVGRRHVFFSNMRYQFKPAPLEPILISGEGEWNLLSDTQLQTKMDATNELQLYNITKLTDREMTLEQKGKSTLVIELRPTF